jgi:hypothetical protein
MSQYNTGRSFDAGSSRSGNLGKDRSDESGSGQSQSHKGGVRQLKKGAKQAVDKVKEQASSAVGEKKDVAAQKLESVSKAFRQSAEGLNQGSVPAVGKILEQAAESIEGLAQSVRDGDFRGVIDGVENWARKHPAIFLGGSLIAGLLVARFLKSSREHEFGAYDTGTSLHRDSDEYDTEFASAGVGYTGSEFGRTTQSSGFGQYGSGSSGSGDVKPGMTVPGTTPGSPSDPSINWEEQ